MIKGIDLSYWQRNNYKALIDNFARDFVIARAAFSRTVDAYCDPIYQYAKSKGKKLGFYFFPLTSDGTPEASAEWAYRQVLGYIGEAMPILDWEATNGTDVSNVDWAYRWLKKFEELSGVKPVIYMNSSVEASYDWSKVVANDNGLWIANYGNNDGSDHGKPGVKQWSVVAMHQFTSLLDGRGLDGDIFYGQVGTWDSYCGKPVIGTTVPSLPTSVKKNNEEVAKEILARTCSDWRWNEWGDRDVRINRLREAGYDYNAVQELVNNLWNERNKVLFYTVQTGDTLSAIAGKHNTTWQQLALLNKLQNPNLIYPSMQLKISGGGSAQPNAKVYTVKAGDTLSSIATQYGTTWQKLAQDNKIQDADLIYPGMVLRIY